MLRRVYIAALSLLLALAAAFSCYPYIRSSETVQSIASGLDFLKNDDNAAPAETEPAVTQPPVTEPAVTEPPVTEPPVTEPPVTEPPVTEPPVTEPPVTEPPVTQPPVTAPPETSAPATQEPPRDYVAPVPVEPQEFDNALFIGDSRTMGLLYYGGIGNADVFATKGMTVYRAFTETINVKSSGDTMLEPLLASRQYERVYIMLGINEIGGSLEAIKIKYAQLVDKVQETQPEAAIYVCANLHVTNSRSQVDSIYNNTRLNALNEYVASLADGERKKYIDVNEVFDDSTGSFGAAYTTDDIHPKPQYYKQWVQWLGTVT
ncbi:MAG: hypothetical protein IJD22_00850 [Clostridia bacterium]|nr:hypothetical protein [Clostridia bacterium]